MIKNRRRILWPLLMASLVLTALTIVASAGLRVARTNDTKITSSHIMAHPPSSRRGAYVRRSLISPKLGWALNALGDRLEKPGRERLSATGTLSGGDLLAEEVRVIWEFPDRLRLTRQRANQTRVIAFDGEQVKAGGNPLDESEQDLLETLVYGSAEHFFNTQMQGMATRFLGSRFRIDDGSSTDYSGPYYDVYKVADRVNTSTDRRDQVKLYYFNSETLLLERVVYEITRNGSIVNVEERLGDWTTEQGQRVVRRIERFENGQSVFLLTVGAADLSPSINDGVFAN